MTEKNPQSAVQREARQVKGPYGGRRPYHSRAARDDRDGTSRYRGRKRRLVGAQAGWNRGIRLCIPPLTLSGVGFLLFTPEYKEDYYERGKQSVYL